MKQVKALITETDVITPWANLIWLEAPEIAAEARPGQFVMVTCGPDVFLPRPLSVHQTDGDKLALLFALVGKGTAWLAERKAGDAIDIFGPLGNGYTINPDAKKLLLVAGRIGIAPLFFLAQEAVKRGLSIVTLHGLPTASLKPYPPELWPVPYNLIIATDDGSLGKKGRVSDILNEYTKDIDQILACGPMEMYRTMAKMPELKVRPVQISLEIMMGCGVGICYGCTIKTKKGIKQVCKDGPVFEMGEVEI